MSSRAVRANCFDASALVKLYLDEDGSEIIRSYSNNEPTKYTTQFCFYEALTVLKVKWLYRKEISKEQYLDAAFRLTAWHGVVASRVKDIDFTSPSHFSEAKRIAEKTSLDLSDAFQILSVKSGFFSPLTGGSKTILVTADELLAAAARNEGIRVWYFMREPAPE